MDPRADLEAIFLAVRNGADPGETVRGSAPARAFLSGSFSGKVESHLRGAGLREAGPGGRQVSDATSKLVYHPKVIKIPELKKKKRAVAMAPKQRQAALKIQCMYRQAEARRFVRSKQERCERIQVSAQTASDPCDICSSAGYSTHFLGVHSLFGFTSGAGGESVLHYLFRG